MGLVNFPLPQGMLFLPYITERQEWMAYTYAERAAYELMKWQLEEVYDKRMEQLHLEFWGIEDVQP